MEWSKYPFSENMQITGDAEKFISLEKVIKSNRSLITAHNQLP